MVSIKHQVHVSIIGQQIVMTVEKIEDRCRLHKLQLVEMSVTSLLRCASTGEYNNSGSYHV